MKLVENCICYLWHICGPLACAVGFISLPTSTGGWHLTSRMRSRLCGVILQAPPARRTNRTNEVRHNSPANKIKNFVKILFGVQGWIWYRGAPGRRILWVPQARSNTFFEVLIKTHISGLPNYVKIHDAISVVRRVWLIDRFSDRAKLHALGKFYGKLKTNDTLCLDKRQKIICGFGPPV